MSVSPPEASNKYFSDLLTKMFPGVDTSKYLLPSNNYWKSKNSYESTGGIANWDAVKANAKGSNISLKVQQADPIIQQTSGIKQIGTVVFAARDIEMSQASDSITVSCSNTSLSGRSQSALSIWGKGDSFLATRGMKLDLGNGNNKIEAGMGHAAWDTGISIGNQSSIVAGKGSDSLKAAGAKYGLWVYGSISTGGGNDNISGTSMTNEMGIYVAETGIINMGDGDDVLTGISKARSNNDDRSIYCNGMINMGADNDRISGNTFCMSKAQGLETKLDMGSGNDSLEAILLHSSGIIDFGSGIDKMTLSKGKYQISSISGGGYSILSTDTQHMYGGEKIYGLEFIISAAKATQYAVTPGILNVA